MSSAPDTDQNKEIFERSLSLAREEMASMRAYGDTLIRSSLLLNGGALFAVPAFIEAVSNGEGNASFGWMGITIFLFVFGVLTGAATGMLGFVSQNHTVSAIESERDKAYLSFEKTGQGPNPDLLKRQIELGKESKRLYKFANRLSSISWFTIVASYVCFVLGILIFAIFAIA